MNWATVPPSASTQRVSMVKCRLTNSVTASGVLRSASVVKPTMSVSITVTSRRCARAVAKSPPLSSCRLTCRARRRRASGRRRGNGPPGRARRRAAGGRGAGRPPAATRAEHEQGDGDRAVRGDQRQRRRQPAPDHAEAAREGECHAQGRHQRRAPIPARPRRSRRAGRLANAVAAISTPLRSTPCRLSNAVGKLSLACGIASSW